VAFLLLFGGLVIVLQAIQVALLVVGQPPEMANRPLYALSLALGGVFGVCWIVSGRQFWVGKWKSGALLLVVGYAFSCAGLFLMQHERRVSRHQRTERTRDDLPDLRPSAVAPSPAHDGDDQSSRAARE
jgi:hypothetical protein